MYQTQQALIAHLQSATLAAQTIDEYAGQLTGSTRQRVDYPAIFILYRDGTVLKQLPDIQFELLFVSTNKYHDNEEAEKNALQTAEPYCDWLVDNRKFEDPESYYELIDLQQARLTTTMNNHQWTVLSLKPLTIQVDRQV